MSQCGNISIATFFVLLCVADLNAQDDANFQRPPEADEIKLMVDDILHGAHLEEYKAAVDRNAWFIDGVTDQYLYEVLFGSEKSATFESERQRMVVMHKLWISPDFKSAAVIVKTVRKDRTQPRFHSVSMVKSSKGDWIIKHWHTSN